MPHPHPKTVTYTWTKLPNSKQDYWRQSGKKESIGNASVQELLQKPKTIPKPNFINPKCIHCFNFNGTVLVDIFGYKQMEIKQVLTQEKKANPKEKILEKNSKKIIWKKSNNLLPNESQNLKPFQTRIPFQSSIPKYQISILKLYT